MGKLTLYISILIVSLLLFHFTGLIHDTSLSFLLKALQNPESLKTEVWYTAIIGIFTAFAGIGVIIGTILPAKVDQAVTITFSSVLLSAVIWDIFVAFNAVKDTSGFIIASLIILPLFMLSFLVVLEWWRGISGA